MGVLFLKRLLSGTFLWAMLYLPVFGQGIYVDLNSIPKTGTALIYAHQDDDLIWMLPFWKVTEKFIGGAMPPTPRSRRLIHQQQQHMDSIGYGVDYENNWITPWADITDDGYNQYYWVKNPAYDSIALDHLEEHADLSLPMSQAEINKLKAKIEQYIASPAISRIMTHNIWGEYGHYHHVGVDIAVRELAVKYRKDVWMLGCDNGNFINVDIPPGITYTTGSYDSALYARIRNIYKANYYWTWDDNTPTGPYNYIKIVDAGIDKSAVFTGEPVNTPGPYQDVPGAYIFDGIDDYLTLSGNNYSTFTIAMSVRPDVIKEMDITKMSEYPSAPTCDRSFYLQSTGQLTARIFDGQSKTVTSGTALVANKWADIVMTGDGSNLKIYINGILEGSVAAGTPATYLSPEFVLGQAQETSSFFEGQISDVRFYDHALTDSEIAALAHSLKISGLTADNKVYDGTTEASLNTDNLTLIGVQPGDNVTLNSSGATGVFADKNAGSSKTVSTSGFTLGGVNASKYSLVQPSLTADITPSSINLSGVTAKDKSYDGTIEANINTEGAQLGDVLPGDDLSLVVDGASGTFADKNVGTAKLVTTSGFTLAGADAHNYSMAQPVITAAITAIDLTISGVTAYNKIYDGTTVAQLNNGSAILAGVILGDDVSLFSGHATGTFSDKIVGTGKEVVTSGFILVGADNANYSLIQPATSADITSAVLTVSGLTAANKYYDGTTGADLITEGAYIIGAVTGDDVSLLSTDATGTFLNKNAGTEIPVLVSGFTLNGNDAVNYNLTQPSPTATIYAKELTIDGTFTAADKGYDGTNSATILTNNLTLVSKEPMDDVNLVSVSEFTDAYANTGKTVTLSGSSLDGTDALNYTLSLTGAPTTTATINSKVLTVTGITAFDKSYDGTTSASLNTDNAILTGVLGTDAVVLGTSEATGTFVNRTAGVGKAVSTSGFTLGGSDAGNYTLIQPSLVADINAADLTISGVTATDKIYDGSASVILNTGSASLEGFLPGDDVNLVLSGAGGTFLNKNVGENKPVSISGFTISGADAVNYALIQPETTASITTSGLTISGVLAARKIYNGTTESVLNTENAVLAGVVPGDAVVLISSGSKGVFADKNVGVNKEIITTGFTIDGTDAINYSLSQPIVTADIMPLELTVTGATANDKVYDGTNSATLNPDGAILNGVLTGDNVHLVSTSATGTFENQNSGVLKTVTTSGFTLEGPDAANYLALQPLLTGSISAKRLIITANDLTKVYGTSLIFSGTEVTFDGLISGDSVTDITISSPGAVSSADAGIYTISLTGGNNDNYQIELVNSSLSVLKAPLYVIADDKTKQYNQINPELTISYSGFVPGQNSNVLDELPVVETDADTNSDAGIYSIIISGGSDSNYSFIYANGTLTINKADQEIIFEKIPSDLKINQGYQLQSKATSGLPVSYTVSDPNSASLNGDFLTIERDGKIVITATQDGSNNWNPAPEVSQSILVGDEYNQIPSLFTPNNDGVNDCWKIPNLEQYGKLEVSIYNRYGQTVYQSNDYKNDWYGTWNTNPLPSASYYYIIKSTTKGIIKGVVNILR
jgi:gliding motility-associated-like protein